MEEEQSPQEAGKPAPAAKKGLPGAILMIGAIIATGASAAAGAVLGPALAAHKGETAAHAAASASAEVEPTSEALALEPIIVDVREAGGELHHLKISLALELEAGVKEEEFKRLIPRIRDAAITYLRGLPFDEVTTSAKFDPIRTELGARIAHAAGKDAAGKNRVRRVLFTDFVAQ